MSEFESDPALDLDLLDKARHDPVVAGILKSAEQVNSASRREGGTECLVPNSVDDLNALWKKNLYLNRPVRHHGLQLPLTHSTIFDISRSGVLSLEPWAFDAECWDEAEGTSKGFVAVEMPSSYTDHRARPDLYIMHRFITKDGRDLATHVGKERQGTIEFPGYMSLEQAKAYVSVYDSKTDELIQTWEESGIDDAVTTLRRVDLGRYHDGRVGDDYIVAVNTRLLHIRKLTSGHTFQGIVKGLAYIPVTSQLQGGEMYLMSDNISVNYVGALVHTVRYNNGDEEGRCEVYLDINVTLPNNIKQRVTVPISSLKHFEAVAVQ